MNAPELDVLIVEDESITARTYAGYLARIPGFRAARTAHSLAEARRVMHAALRGDRRIEVILLDLNLPDGHGLDLLTQLRAAGYTGTVLALTAATELPAVRRALALGVAHYLIKPFGFEEFAQRLAAVRLLTDALAGPGGTADQSEVDRVFRSAAPGAARRELPKGLSPETLTEVSRLLRERPAALSALEAAEATGTSRVTARRYLEHLVTSGRVVRLARKGGRGRPELEYRWRD